VWVVVLLPLLMDVALRMDGWAQIVVAGLAPLWTMVLLMWPLQARPEEARAPNGVIWVAYRHDQPVQWFGEHVYVLAVLATMLLAAWWLRNARGPEAAAAATTAWTRDAFVASR
jgi:hypothetical protein